jgi:hypothetical protein
MDLSAAFFDVHKLEDGWVVRVWFKSSLGPCLGKPGPMAIEAGVAS